MILESELSLVHLWINPFHFYELTYTLGLIYPDRIDLDPECEENVKFVQCPMPADIHVWFSQDEEVFTPQVAD